MSATVTIDTDSDPGSYRRAIDPNAASCRACGQDECSHPDAIYQGVVPPLSDRPFHQLSVTPEAPQNHVR